MRECRSSGSVEGVISDGHSYSDSNFCDLKETIRPVNGTLNAWTFVKSARSFTMWQAGVSEPPWTQWNRLV